MHESTPDLPLWVSGHRYILMPAANAIYSGRLWAARPESASQPSRHLALTAQLLSLCCSLQVLLYAAVGIRSQLHSDACYQR
jgi:hypothetical protein